MICHVNDKTKARKKNGKIPSFMGFTIKWKNKTPYGVLYYVLIYKKDGMILFAYLKEHFGFKVENELERGPD